MDEFPAREGYEDLVELRSDPANDVAWTAVSFPEEGYLWFSLKNPKILRSTILWFSNLGRDHAPWNGRHGAVVGLEEVTAEFNFGLAESVATGQTLDMADLPPVSVLMGVAEIGPDFGRVSMMVPEDGGLRIWDDAGHDTVVACDLSWI
ncbi:hypothetical protein EON79_01375 [bacterium]|nr:MAG: hypothetical protein EON79_01375 [bacterium]